jgi:prevent-host-death family protein
MVQAKTVSATEAKNRLGGLLGDVAEGDADVIIENFGRPRAVLVSFESYQDLLAARERKRREEAMEALRKLREEVRAQNLDLDEDTADEVAEEISQEAIARIIERNRRRRVEARQ